MENLAIIVLVTAYLIGTTKAKKYQPLCFALSALLFGIFFSEIGLMKQVWLNLFLMSISLYTYLKGIETCHKKSVKVLTNKIMEVV